MTMVCPTRVWIATGAFVRTIRRKGEDAMAEVKTKPTDSSIDEFLARIEDPQKRADSHTLVDLMRRVTGKPPRLWGSIVGFGSYHYKYASGHEGDSCLTGFSPRKAEFSIYLDGYPENEDDRAALLAKLGKHRMGKGCLYVKRLDAIDIKVLELLIRQSVKRLSSLYPSS
jgi:hypothetical protein